MQLELSKATYSGLCSFQARVGDTSVSGWADNVLLTAVNKECATSGTPGQTYIDLYCQPIPCGKYVTVQRVHSTNGLAVFYVNEMEVDVIV